MYTSTSTNPLMCMVYICIYMCLDILASVTNTKLVAIRANFTFMFSARCHNKSEHDCALDYFICLFASADGFHFFGEFFGLFADLAKAFLKCNKSVECKRIMESRSHHTTYMHTCAHTREHLQTVGAVDPHSGSSQHKSMQTNQTSIQISAL